MPEINLDIEEKYVERKSFWIVMTIGWGSMSTHFDKRETTVSASSRSELKERLMEFAKREIVSFTRLLSYDCDRLDHPLNPFLSNITIVEVKPTLHLHDETYEFLQNFMKNENEWVEELIKNENLYIDGNYNLELSPKNKKESGKRIQELEAEDE